MAENVVIDRSIKRFEDFCSSDDLSINELRRRIESISSNDLTYSTFLHRACMNKNVTLEIVEYLIDLYPSAVHSTFRIPDNEIESAYPLHLACWNEDCPNEVIQLLLKKAGNCQLSFMCYTIFDYGDTDIHEGDSFGGLPLHFYLSRTTNVDLDIVKQLVSNEYMLQSSDEENLKCTPIHILIHNKSVGDMYEVLQYLTETDPSSLQAKDIYDQTPLYVACEKSYINAKTIELLLRVCPNSIYQPNNCDWLPTHSLCEARMDDEVAVEVLKLLLEAHPDSARLQTNGDAELPLHLAASNKAPTFCKVLIDAYPEAVKEQNGYGYLPFHFACSNGGRLDTVEYLFKVYPECIQTRDDWGYLPIHSASFATGQRRNNSADIIKFLLLQDPECLSKPVESHYEGDEHRQGNGALPLHLSCNNLDQSKDIPRLLFDLYPEAILIRNERRQLPVDVSRQRLDNSMIQSYPERDIQEMQDFVSYLYTQMGYAIKAQNESSLRRRDRTGSLPLHNAIRSEAPLGSIKLLVKGNNDAINVPDGYGVHPLDIACQFCTVDVVKYLAKLIGNDRLDICDVNKNYPLHHACRGGNCEVIEYLLERPKSSASVSERNADDKLPIHIFCEFVRGRWCEGETPEYTETIWRLLTAYPETLLNW